MEMDSTFVKIINKHTHTYIYICMCMRHERELSYPISSIAAEYRNMFNIYFIMSLLHDSGNKT